MSEICVFGCAGFIGSNIVNYLIQHTGYNIASVDSLVKTQDLRILQAALQSKSRHLLHIMDVDNGDLIDRMLAFEKPTKVIYNLIGADTNGIINHVRLLDAFDRCVKAGVKTFVCLGEYSEEQAKKGCGKLLYGRETDIIDRGKNSGCLVYFVKPCEVFGPRQQTTYPVARQIKNAILGDAQAVLPTNSARLEWMYVKDYFSYILFLLSEESQLKSGIYRLSSGQFATEGEIGKFLNAFAEGNDPLVPETDGSPVLVDGEIYFSWQSANSLYVGLKHTAVWYDVNRWAWEKK